MATITKRGSTYRIVASLGYDVEGKQIRKSTTYIPPEGVTPKKAEKLAKEFAYEFEKRCRGMVELRENMRFSDLCEWYFENYAPNQLKPATAYTYKGQVDKHLLPEFGNMKLRDFTSARITRFFKEKVDLKPITCKKLFTVLQSIFSRAVEQGFIDRTPCERVILPKVTGEKKPFLTDKQAKEILKMTEDYSSQFNVIIRLLLYTGLRSGEALGLEWSDIDFQYHTLRVEHSLADVGGKHFLQAPKTANSKRYIAMSPEVENMLKEHQAHQQEKKDIVGAGYLYPNMVFTTASGNYVDRSGLNTQFKRFVRDTDFSFASLHSLRHCNATLLLNAGADLKVVSEHLGHSGVGITGDIYADVLDAAKRRTADLISLSLKNDD